ncbi:MAG: TIGR03960 family B12-binding radical SAM protein [Clostridia bacterium]|nr:TIGR03960 family B12-binding radical SAM protein [Clostridia bacterium]
MLPEKLRGALKTVEKPGRYIGGEKGEVIKDKKGKIRYCISFPDVYEIGMSNLGIRILYGVLNSLEDVWCERCFAPWDDMAALMKSKGVPLYALESGDPLKAFDFVSFSIQYELSYTNVLYMLDLAGIPFRAADRSESDPVVICGGPCVYNPEPFAEFFDVMSVGEGEEALPELMALYRDCREKGLSKKDFLYRAAAELEGFYVPSLYTPEYKPDGTLAAFVRADKNVPAKVIKRTVKDFDASYYPTSPVVPHIETVHDRVVLEANRGCWRGCRFCQAGVLFRPIRTRKAETLYRQAREAIANTGYSEISLCSLSISDYKELEKFCSLIFDWAKTEHINVSLPSMRLDSFSRELMERFPGLKRSLTFAPEAGTQALRDRIRKGVTEEDLEKSMEVAFSSGRNSVKLYFISGLPTETDEDVAGIARLAEKALDVFYRVRPKTKGGKPVSVNISVSCFIPKPHTPFQWDGQNSLEELLRKQELLRGEIKTRKIDYSWHDARASRIEAVLARGDRRVARAIEAAYRAGQIFDGWDEHFSIERWEKAFEDSGVSPDFYANRDIPLDELLPWDFIDVGVSRAFLEKEHELSRK